jgi:hypothetical protein
MHRYRHYVAYIGLPGARLAKSAKTRQLAGRLKGMATGAGIKESQADLDLIFWIRVDLYQKGMRNDRGVRLRRKQNSLALSIRLSTHPPVKYDCPFPVTFLRRADEIRAEYLFGICESQRLVTLTF